MDKKVYREEPLKELFNISKTNIKPKNTPNITYYHYSIPAYDDLLEPLLQKGGEIKSNKYYLEKDSLLVSKLNPRIKRVWKYNHKENTNSAFCSTEFIVYQPITTNVNLDYYYQYFHSDLFQSTLLQLQSGSTGSRMRVSPNDTLEIPIPVPAYSEQHKIAAILTSMDDAIEKAEAIIAQTEKVKKGLMQKLLTQGIGHTKFKQTEIGKIPEEWEIVKLNKVIHKLYSGVSVNSEDRKKGSNEKGILKTSAVTNRLFDPLEHKTILPYEVKRATVTPKINHIIISRMNTPLLVGASSYVDKDYPDLYVPDRLWQADIINKVANSSWLSFFLTWEKTRSKISSIATGTSGSMKNISQKAFLNLSVSLPTLLEQENIARVLLSFDNKITAEQQKLAQLQTLKKGLMQVLLTGKVRVKVDEDEVVSS